MVLPEPSASVAEPTIQSTKLADKEAPKTQKLESNTQQTTMKPMLVEGDHQYNSIIAVAIDKDKNSQHAVKWAVENLLNEKPTLTLIHVRTRNLGQHMTEVPLESSQQIESDIKQLFLTFRGFCARRGIHLKEVLLDDMDVSDALLGYINKHSVTSIVVGTSTRNMITRRIRNPDVQSSLVKLAPEFCAVFVINSKGKAVTVRSATRPPPVSGTSPKSSANAMGLPPHHHNDYGVIEDAIRTPARGTNWRNAAGRQNNNYNNDFVRMGSRDHKNNSVPRSSISSSLSVDGGFDPGMFTPRMSNVGPDSFTLTDDIDLTTGSFSNNNLKLPWDFSTVDANADISMTSSSSSSSQSSIEAEMKRLKLELDHTMELYSTACREAITAKQKAAELAQWKMDESRRFEEAKQAEEAALKLAMVEKAKYKAALEAAQKVAESEAKKRWEAESKAQQQQQQLQSEERSQVLCTLAKADLLYRKYSIEEISRATNNFTPLLRIGEGGYGPVYRGRLDHTQVAIKVLRPDAAQGMKQFNQEVEVLSCIRHPNMVLLLGACPEYGCLVYEYMDNGSLDDRLFRKGNSPPIPWQIRFKIAAEIATGLLFLHQTKPEPLVHRDLKPGNILLDHNYVSKISDVGLARLVPASIADSVTQYHMTSAAGTFCYIDPEYQQTGMLGTKSDIYSLGILLLQIITAKPPMGLSHHVERSIDKGTFEEILDPSVQDWPIEAVLSFAKIALKCAELRKKDRPDLGTVILPELNRLREFGESEGSNFHDFNNHGPMPFNRSLQLRSGNESPGSNFNIGHPQRSSSTEICMYLPPIEENEEERFFPSKLLDTDNSEE